MTDGMVSSESHPDERRTNSIPGSLDPTRIAFCITELDPGGAERMLVELVTRLNRQRWMPHVFCLSGPGQLVESLAASNVEVTCLGAKSCWQIGVVWRLAAELRKFRPALLQCVLFHANIVGRLAGWWAGIPRIICGIRVAERRSRWPLWLDWLTQGFVDHNVCVSRAVAEFSILDGGLERSKVCSISNGVNFERFATATAVAREALGFSNDAPLVIFVGRLDPQKAPLILLDAFEHLLQRHPSWQLLLVGDGPLRNEITNWITKRGLVRSIRLTGRQSNVPQLLKGADCLVLPSLWEGMPNIVLEAMAAGLPVVVSRVEGTDELVRPEETGLLVEPNSVSDLERQIEVMLTDSELAQRLAKNAQLTVREWFTLDAMVASYEQLFIQVLG